MAGKEMALSLLLQLNDKLSGELDKPSSALSKFGNVAGTVGKIAGGLAVAGIGALTTGLVLSVKAAAEEEKGIAALGAAVTASGGNWKTASKDIEAYLTAELKRTALDDGEGRDSIAQLTTITGDYTKALKLMPLAQDLARAKGMDLASAAQLVGRVSMGNVGILSRYGVVLKEGASATEAIAAMQQKFGGQAEAYGNTYSGQMEKLNIMFGNLKETIGAALLPILTQVGQFLVNTFSNPAVQGAISAVAAGISDIANGVMLLIQGDPSSFFELLANGLAGIGIAFGGSGAAMGGFVATLFGLYTQAQNIANVFISYLVPALVNLQTMWATVWPVITAAFAAAWAIIQPILQMLTDFFVVNIIGALTNLQTMWTTLWPALVAAVSTAWATIQPSIQMIVSMIQVAIPAALAVLQSLWAAAWGQMQWAVKTAINLILPIVQQGIGTIASLVQTALPVVQAIFSKVWGAVQSIINTVLNDIVPKIRAGFEQILSWVNTNWPRIEAIIKTVWNAILAIIQAVVNEVVPFIMEQFGGIIAWVNENWPLISQTITTVLNAVLLVVESVLGAIKTFWAAHGETMLTIVNLMWSTIKTVISTAINVVLSIIKAVMQAINGDWAGAWDTLKGAAAGVLTALQTLIENGLNIILALFGTTLDNVIAVVTEKITAFTTLGKAIIMGLVDGVLGNIRSLIEAVTNAIKEAIQAAKDFLGAHSPSRVFMDLGSGMMVGMAMGITADGDKPVKALRAVVNRMTTAAITGIRTDPIAAILAQVQDIIALILRTVDLINQQYWMDQAQRAAATATALTTVFEMFSRAITAYVDIGAFSAVVGIGDKIAAFIADVHVAFTALMGIAKWAFNAEDIKLGGEVADIIKNVITIATKYVELSVVISQLTSDPRLIGDMIGKIIDDLRNVFLRFVAISREMTTGITAAALVLTSMQNLINLVASAVDAMTTLATYKSTGVITQAGLLFDDLKQFVIKATGFDPGQTVAELDAIGTTLNAISGVVAPIKGMVDALTSLADYKPVADIAGKMKSLVDGIALAIAEIGRIAGAGGDSAGADPEALKKLAEMASAWAAAIGPAVGAIRGMVDALTSLADYKPTTGIAAKMKIVADQIGMAMLELSRVALWRDIKVWTLAGAWATAVGPAIGVIRSMVDALTALAEYKPVTGIAAKVKVLADQIGMAMLEFARIGAWRDIKVWDTAGAWATAVGPAIAIIKGAIDALDALAKYTPVTGIAAKMVIVANQIGMALLEFARVASWRDIKTWDTAGVWATAIGPAVNLIKGAVDALVALAKYEPVTGIAAKMVTLANQIGMAMAEFAKVATGDSWGGVDWGGAGTWATKVSPAVNLVKGAIDALNALFAYVPQDITAQAQALAEKISEVVRAIALIAKAVGEEAAKSAGAFATDANVVMQLVKSGVEALNALATFGTAYITPEKIDVFADIIRYTVEMIAWMATQAMPGAVTVAKDFSTDAQVVFTMVKGAVDWLKGLGDLDLTKISQVVIDTLVGRMLYVINAVVWLATAVGPVAREAAKSFAADMEPVFEFMKKALDFLGALAAAALPNLAKVDQFVAIISSIAAALGNGVRISAQAAYNALDIAKNMSIVDAYGGSAPKLNSSTLTTFVKPAPIFDWRGIVGMPTTPIAGGGGGGGGGGGALPTVGDAMVALLTDIRDILAEELALGAPRTTLATREAIYDALGPIVATAMRRQARGATA